MDRDRAILIAVQVGDEDLNVLRGETFDVLSLIGEGCQLTERDSTVIVEIELVE